MFNAKYYAVICKCGHVGRKRSYTCVKFPIKAHSAYEAESIARNIPRVKHGSATAILKITEIDYSTFARILFENSLNPYLHCHSDEESEEKGVRVKTFREPEMLPGPGNSRGPYSRTKPRYRGKNIIRNVRTYSKMNPVEEEEDYDL